MQMAVDLSSLEQGTWQHCISNYVLKSMVSLGYGRAGYYDQYEQ